MKNVDFGKTHDLEFLLQLCIQQDSNLKKLDIGNLKFYAVEVRYPDEFYIPSVEEARECFEIATKIKDFILKKLGIENDEILKGMRE